MTEETEILNILATEIDSIAIRQQRKYYLSPFTDIEELIKSIKSVADLKQFYHDVQISQYNLFEFQCGIPGVWCLNDYRGVPKRYIFMLREAYQTIKLTSEERLAMASLTILEN